MKNNLIIVESPKKAITISKFLNNTYYVLASYGHIKDILPRKNSINIENNFEIKFSFIKKNTKYINKIIKIAKIVENIYLATDSDREGEAIAYHIQEEIRKRIKKNNIYRIIFNQINKKTIEKSLLNPQTINMNLVNSQKSRRIIDFLVGFFLSPLLWKKLMKGLSAGRVQSPALKMIIDKEKEIEAFNKKKFWYITANSIIKKIKIIWNLSKYYNSIIEKTSISKEIEVFEFINNISNISKKIFYVINKKENILYKKSPNPFITSSLQQESYKQLNFTAKKTMLIAQQLYEGIKIKNNLQGLITYMRTDSYNISNDFIKEIKEFIILKYGKEYFEKNKKKIKKIKNSQESHEAIRPISININPSMVKKYTNDDQYLLYKLIWQRTLMSQMSSAKYKIINIIIGNKKEKNEFSFSSKASLLYFQGYKNINFIKKDNNIFNIFSSLSVNDKITLENIEKNEYVTMPPKRFAENSLIKQLEIYGIGRPSTYVSIIETLKNRNYIKIIKKKFFPTTLGYLVTDFLKKYFLKYINYKFTAKLENSLDDIAKGTIQYLDILNNFWKPFIKLIDNINDTIPKKKVLCDKINRKCIKCMNELVIRIGKHGKFIGCSNYPSCKYIEDLKKYIKLNIKCPLCTVNYIVEKFTRYKKKFYACEGYPKCQYAIWDKPIDKKCPQCNWNILLIKKQKDIVIEYCPNKKNCHYVNKKNNKN